MSTSLPLSLSIRRPGPLCDVHRVCITGPAWLCGPLGFRYVQVPTIVADILAGIVTAAGAAGIVCGFVAVGLLVVGG